MCSRKDYVAIAAALKSQRESYAPHWDKNLFRAMDDTCKAMAQVFANDNPRFDRAKFYAACGMES
jgi:hypothetical protein